MDINAHPFQNTRIAFESKSDSDLKQSYVLFKVLSYYPHKFNYAIKISNENAECQYKLSLRTLRIIGFNITLLLSFISYKISKPISAGSSSLEWWFIPLLLISLITPTLYLVIASNSKKLN